MAQPPSTAKASAAKAMFEKAAADSSGPAARPGPGMLSRATSHAVLPGAGRTLGVATGGSAGGAAGGGASPGASPTKPAPLARAGSFSVRGASPQPAAAEPAVPEWQLKRQAKIAAAPPTVVERVAAPAPAPAAAAAPAVAAPKPVAPTLARMGTSARLNSSANLHPSGGAKSNSASPAASPSTSPTARTRTLSASPQPQPQEKEEPKEDPNKWIKNPAHLDGVGDMSALIYLDPPNILWNLQKRYEKAEIYTAISKVLVAINPYELHDVYSGWHINEYRRQAHLRLNTLPPHVFSVAQQAYHQMEITDSNQSMIVCGESGSGKTESAKHLMRYFAFNSKKKDSHVGSEDEAAAKAKADLAKAERDRKRAMGKHDDEEDEGFQVEELSIEGQVLAANPILEAFGNAKTVLNNNSSRFGKFTKLVFDEEHPHGHDPHAAAAADHDPDAPPKRKPINPKFIVGSFIETYLLEKSRVCKQEPGERNYHVFYHLCSDGGLAPDVRAKLFLDAADKYTYLQGGGTYTVDGINDGKLMRNLQKAMTQLKINAAQQMEVFQIVSGVLHLGNMKFKPINADSVEVDPACATTLKQAAALFAVDEKKLTARLTTRNITVSKNVITKPLSKADADQNRDAMAKALYNGLFLWIVHKINGELYPVDARKDDLKWIGILDVFGFESFANNSFEQFCINFANETLQQYFNTYILSSEQDEYRIEGIFWKPIKVPNNQDVLDLIDLPPKSILATLDSACRTPKADDKSFVSSLFEIHRKHPRLAMVTRVPNKAAKSGYDAINGFSVKHYAGTVIYNAKEFLPKNADSTHPDTIALFSGSQLATVAGVFGDHGGHTTGRHTGFISTGYVFSQQLRSLMNLLHQTTPYFVRCVKPNPSKKPRSFLWDYTRPQLECGGLIEALRILKLGYPTRVTYVKLYERYGRILKPEPPNLNKRDFSEAILVVCGKGILDANEYQLGLTKVFFRPGKQSFLEDLLHSGQELSAQTVKEIKKFLLQKRVARARASVKAHARFTLRLRRMRGLVRFRKLSAVMTKAAKAFFTPLKRIRQVNAARVVQAHILMHMHAARYDALKRVAVRLVVIRRYHKARVAIKRELDKRIAVKREIARKQKEEEERMAALQKIEDDLKEAKHGFANLTGDEKVLEHDLVAQLQSGELLVTVINRIAPNFKLKPVAGAKSPIQVQENWSMAIRGMTGLGLNKRLLNFTGDDGAKGDRDVFVAKVLPAVLELIKIGYMRAPALRPKAAEPAHDDDHHDAAGAGAGGKHVEVPTAAPVDKSEVLPPLKVGPTGDGFFALLQRGGFFGVYRSGGGVAASEKDAPVRAFANAVDPGVFAWRAKDEQKTELGKIDMNIITAIKPGREDGNDVDPNPPAAPTPAAAAAPAAPAAPAAAAGATNASAGAAAGAPAAGAAAGAAAAAPKVRAWFTLFCGADHPALVLQADSQDMRDQWVRALRYCLRNVREFKTLARPKGDPLRGNLTYCLLMEEVEALREHKEMAARDGGAAARAAAEKAAAEAKAAAESEAKALAAAAAAEEARKVGEKAAADLLAAERKFEAELNARSAEFDAKLKQAEADRKASAEVQAQLDAYAARVAALQAKVVDLEKNPPLPPPEIIKQRQIIQIEHIFADPTGPAKPLHADLDVAALADEKALRDTALALHKRNNQLEDAIAVAKLYFSGYLHMNDSRMELNQFLDKHVRLPRDQLEAAALGTSSSSTDAAVERDIRAGEMQQKARRIKQQRELMKTMRIVKRRKHKRSPSQGEGEDEKYARPPTARALFAAASASTSSAAGAGAGEEKSAEPAGDVDAPAVPRSPSKSVSLLGPADSDSAATGAPDGTPTTANGDSTTAVLSSPSVTVVRSVASAKPWTVQHVGPSWVFNRMAAFGAPLVVDTRSAELYRAGHIPGAISMPVSAADVGAQTPLTDLELRMVRMEKLQFARRGRRTIVVYGDGAGAGAPADAAASPAAANGDAAAGDAKDVVAEYVANALHTEAKVAGADVLTGGWNAFNRAYPFLSCAFSEADAKSGRHRHLPVVPWFPSEVVDGFLYLGNVDDAHNYERLKRLGITRVLNCTAEVAISDDVKADSAMKWLHLELSDDEQQDIASSFDAAFAFIDQAKADGARILVHCQQGISRSATVVIAWLIKARQCSLKEAFDTCKNARPKVLPNAGFWEQLSAFEVKHWHGAKGDAANSTLKACVDLGLVQSPQNKDAAAAAADASNGSNGTANGTTSPSRASHDDAGDASESDGDDSDDEELLVDGAVDANDDTLRARKEERAKARAARHAKTAEWKQKEEAEVVKRERDALPAEEVVKLEWFEVVGRACADADTPYVLGACFEEGRGVRKDLRKAAYWYDVASQRGSGPATHALAMAYAHGKGVPKDERKAVELLQRAATALKHTKSMFALGVYYSMGKCGLPRDLHTAVAWYRKAADAGHVHALFNLAVCHLLGTGVSGHKAERERIAVQLYEKAAALGYAGAQFNLGVFHANGSYGVPKDQRKALVWYDRAARQGYPSAAFNLAACYAAGNGIVQDASKAARWYEAAAQAGHANAQFNLALCYDHGTGVPRDEKKAFEWYSAAAKQGHAKAQYNLGLCYRYGRGTRVDLVRAADAYEQSAAQGYVLAQYNLAAAYSDGKGVAKDQKRAADWYARAAEQKYPNAQYNLAVYYVHGTGVPKDDARAFQLFVSAASAGNVRAQRWAGVMYDEGKGTAPDPLRAFELLKAAANAGDAVAQHRLGVWYRVGRPEAGVSRNDSLASAYLKAAAAQGHAPSGAVLQDIKSSVAAGW